MIKLVYATDSHGKVRGPSLRTDNYAGTVLRKYDELGNVAHKIGAVAVLNGGDMFDTARVADSFKGDLGRLILSWKIPMYVVPGNHDEWGHTLSTLDSCSLGLFYKLGIVKPLIRSMGPVYFSDGKITVSVTGQEYHHELDRRDPALDYYVDEDVLANFRILVIHSMLLPKPFLPDQAHTLIDDVPVDTPTSPDLILAGHYHPGWPMERRGTVRPTLFVNPGSMLRTDVGWDNMNRMPGYNIIEIDGSGIQVTWHQFQCAQPSVAILNRAARDAENQRKKTLESFRQNINQNANLKGQDLVSIADNIVTSEGIDRAVRDAAINRMDEAKVLVEDEVQHLENYVDKPWPYNVVRVEAENFQSWEKLEMDLDAGLNMILGPTDKGKSAIIRVINWVLKDEPKGAGMIRWGAEKQTMTVMEDGQPVKLEYQVLGSITFSDGSKLTRGRTEKSAGFYLLELPDGTVKVFKAFANKLPPDIYNVTQMPPLTLAKGVTKSLNVQTQHEGTFLLSDEPSVRAAIIGHLTGVQVVDMAIREVGRDIVNAQREIKSKQRDRERLTAELAGFDDLQQELQVLNACETALMEAAAVQVDLDLIAEAQNSLADLARERTEVAEEIREAEAKLTAEPLVEQAMALAAEIQPLTEAINDLQAIAEERASLEKTIKDSEAVIALAPLLEEAKRLSNEIEDIGTLQAELQTIRTQKHAEMVIIVRANERLKVAPKIEEATNLLTELEELAELRADLEDVREAKAKGRKFMTDLEAKIGRLAADYAEELQRIGVCPTCSSVIGPERVSEIIAHHIH